jgi:hypothetical protein
MINDHKDDSNKRMKQPVQSLDEKVKNLAEKFNNLGEILIKYLKILK